MDDAGGLAFEVVFDEEHHAPVALGDDVFLGDAGALVAAEGALHDIGEGGVGGAGFPAQAGEFGGGAVLDFAAGADGAVDGVFQFGELG